MKITHFVIILLVCLCVMIINHIKVESFSYSDSNLPGQKMIPNTKFSLVSSDGLNLSYIGDRFYLTNGPEYKFVSTPDFDNSTNSLYKLLSSSSDGFVKFDLTLQYNSSEPSESKVIQVNKQSVQADDIQNIFTQNTSQRTLKNIFSLQDSSIYWDPLNKVIMSNDSGGNIIYLSKVFPNSPVSWDYNIFNGVNFDIKIENNI